MQGPSPEGLSPGTPESVRPQRASTVMQCSSEYKAKTWHTADAPQGGHMCCDALGSGDAQTARKLCDSSAGSLGRLTHGLGAEASSALWTSLHPVPQNSTSSTPVILQGHRMKPLLSMGQAARTEHIVQVFLSEQGPSVLAGRQ